MASPSELTALAVGALDQPYLRHLRTWYEWELISPTSASELLNRELFGRSSNAHFENLSDDSEAHSTGLVQNPGFRYLMKHPKNFFNSLELRSEMTSTGCAEKCLSLGKVTGSGVSGQTLLRKREPSEVNIQICMMYRYQTVARMYVQQSKEEQGGEECIHYVSICVCTSVYVFKVMFAFV